MTPENPIVGGTTLIRPAIQSPNFVEGVSGWAIRLDGSAEFNQITLTGGRIVIIVPSDQGGIFAYEGTPTLGNLIMSIAPTSGIDPYGNSYPVGFFLQTGGGATEEQVFVNSTAIAWIQQAWLNDPSVEVSTFVTDPPWIGITAPSNDVGFSTPRIQLTGPSASGGGQPGSITSTHPIIVDSSWHNITPQNGWSNAGSPNPPWSVRQLADGTVAFRGTLTGGTRTDGTLIGTLPAGYFSTAFQAFPPIGYTGAATCRLVINPANGQITIDGMSTAPGFIQFDGFFLPII